MQRVQGGSHGQRRIRRISFAPIRRGPPDQLNGILVAALSGEMAAVEYVVEGVWFGVREACDQVVRSCEVASTDDCRNCLAHGSPDLVRVSCRRPVAGSQAPRSWLQSNSQVSV